jgi:hypothetical protein
MKDRPTRLFLKEISLLLPNGLLLLVVVANRKWLGNKIKEIRQFDRAIAA